MNELMEQISAALKGMWKYRWQGLAVAWLTAIASVAVVMKWPDQYEASARIFVDTQSILKPLMAGLAVQPNIDQQVVMLSRTLISRPNVEKLIRMADLDLKSESKIEQEVLIERLTKALQIKSTDRDNLYTLSFRDEDAARAKRVIQSLVSIFVESSLGASRKDNDSAKLFLNEQIKSYEAKLEDAESRLKDFRLRNLDLLQGEGKGAAERLSDIKRELQKATLELREAESARDAAKAQLASEKSDSQPEFPDLLNESAIKLTTPEIDSRIEAQKKALDSLRQRFTDLHPDIISGQRLIKELEEQRERELQELRRSAMAKPASSVSPNNGALATQEIRKMLAAAEVQVAALQARVNEYSARYNRAMTLVRTSPQLEAEAAQLNRDYAINKKNYENLVARRESAVMSGQLDVASGVADFRLIDPPRVSPKPVSPNRLLLLPLALVAALGAGLFTAFAGSQLRPVFFKTSELRERFGLPVLGAVSLVMSDADGRRERSNMIRFWVGSGSLVATFLAGMLAMSLRV